MNILDFQKHKISGKKISFVTCYDFTSAKIVEGSDVDGILVGDTLAMTMHGHPTTLPASIELMALHTQAVVRAVSRKFIVVDLPFLSYRKSLTKAIDAVQALMQSGAHAIKLEGVYGNVELIQHLVESGIPVMGHIGLTPQSVYGLGGFKVQGRGTGKANNLIEQAKLLEESGCFSIVLECMPASVAHKITAALQIPTIGIGAGPHTNGQVLVWQDLLGMQQDLKIKFVKQYFNGFEMIKNALNAYHGDVQESLYPDIERHCYKEFV